MNVEVKMACGLVKALPTHKKDFGILLTIIMNYDRLENKVTIINCIRYISTYLQCMQTKFEPMK